MCITSIRLSIFFVIIFFNFHNRLGTNYLDAYYIHSPLATPAQRAKVWEEMAKLKKEGLIRACGVV
jgi:diketogulonate reductase-like aldo/keto reductase